MTSDTNSGCDSSVGHDAENNSFRENLDPSKSGQ
jgi:hypothetical protein